MDRAEYKLLILNNNIMGDRVLYIVSGHQDRKEVLDFVIENLKKIQQPDVDICYVTHASLGIDEISKYCKYVVFDRDNEYPTEKQFIENLNYIQKEELLGNLFVNRFTGFRKNTTRFFEHHSRGATSNLRSGVDIAIARGYDWIVYFEADTVLPDKPIKDHFDGVIDFLNRESKKGYYYECLNGRTGVAWPHLFIFKTEVFSSNEKFMSDWTDSSQSFLRCYGNKYFEQILENTVSDSDVIKVPSTRYNEDFGCNHTSAEAEISLYNAIDSEYHNSHPRRRFNDFVNVGIYANLIETEIYNLEIWIDVKRPSGGYTISDLSITLVDGKKEDLLFFMEYRDLNQEIWYFNTFISNYKYNPFDRRYVQLSYKIKSNDAFLFEDGYKVYLSSLEKFHFVKCTSNI